MEEKIIQRLYFKIILAGVSGVALCITAAFLLNSLAPIWTSALVISAAVFAWLSIRSDIAQSKIVSVYVQCCDVMNGRSYIKANSHVTFRFLVKDIYDSSVYLYIKGETGKFREGERYCLLFKKSQDNSYNEQNLLAYGIVPPDIETFPADKGTGKASDIPAQPVVLPDDIDVAARTILADEFSQSLDDCR